VPSSVNVAGIISPVVSPDQPAVKSVVETPFMRARRKRVAKNWWYRLYLAQYGPDMQRAGLKPVKAVPFVTRNFSIPKTISTSQLKEKFVEGGAFNATDLEAAASNAADFDPAYPIDEDSILAAQQFFANADSAQADYYDLAKFD